MLNYIIRDFKKHTAVKIIEQIKQEPESRREMLLKTFKEEEKKDTRVSKYKFWQQSNHANELVPWHINMIELKLNCVHNNPVESEIVFNANEYLYSWARDYANEKGLVKVSFL